MTNENVLFYGDNLEILKKEFSPNSIDLIYLDPPFNSKVNYNIYFNNQKNQKSSAQIEVFEDTWVMNEKAIKLMNSIKKIDPKVFKTIDAFYQILGHSSMMAYVVYMTVRLIELHKCLRDTGSLFLHCDPTASHYMKIILDEIFQPKNFRNEIIWNRASTKNKGSQYEPRKLGTSHDVILFYAKDVEQMIFYPPKVAMSQKELLKLFPDMDEKGRYNTKTPIFREPSLGERPTLCYTWKGFTNPHTSGWRLSKSRLEEEYEKGNILITGDKIKRKAYEQDYKGNNLNDVWIDIPIASGHERIGYPTQKPVALLERIIKCCTKEGDVVLDPFCGCGTTMVASEKLNRKWTGIDITCMATSLLEFRMHDQFKKRIRVEGVPQNIEEAKMLFEKSPFQFQTWAVSRIKGIHPNKKVTGDGGIDGQGWIGPKSQYLVYISVKGGKNLQPDFLRSLNGTVNRDGAHAGILLTLYPPTKGMNLECMSYGYMDTPLEIDYPKIQIFTIEDYFKGKLVKLPEEVQL